VVRPPMTGKNIWRLGNSTGLWSAAKSSGARYVDGRRASSTRQYATGGRLWIRVSKRRRRTLPRRRSSKNERGPRRPPRWRRDQDPLPQRRPVDAGESPNAKWPLTYTQP
jgi:hypothetical protein